MTFTTARTRLHRAQRSLFLAAGFGFTVAILLAGCKSRHEPAPRPGTSSAAIADIAQAPCSVYAARLCEIAGAESPTCQVMRAASEVMAPSACTAGLADVAYSKTKIVKDQKACEYLVQKVCEAVGPETKTCAKITEETRNFTAKKCQAMTAHLTEVIAEVKGMQLTHEAVSPSLQQAMVADAAVNFGPAKTTVQVVEFTDFECTACARMAHVVKRLHDEYADRVHFTFRQFPLSKHPNAHLAAEAALSANKQGKFWAFHEQLFAKQQDLGPSGLRAKAQAAGLDLAAFDHALSSHEFSNVVDADVKLGEGIPVERTPSVYINGVRIDYAAEYESVAKQIDTALNSEPH